MLTRAELVGLTLVWGFAGPVVLLYCAAAAGLGVPSAGTNVITAILAVAFVLARTRALTPRQRPKSAMQIAAWLSARWFVRARGIRKNQNAFDDDRHGVRGWFPAWPGGRTW